eukprot:2278489-Prymnesium_polylepis.1
MEDGRRKTEDGRRKTAHMRLRIEPRVARPPTEVPYIPTADPRRVRGVHYVDAAKAGSIFKLDMLTSP